jgi:hypothetical protein
MWIGFKDRRIIVNMYQCSYCEKTFTDKSNMNRHVKGSIKCVKGRTPLEKSVVIQSDLSCLCTYSTSRADALSRHQASCNVFQLEIFKKRLHEKENTLINTHEKTISAHEKTIANFEEQVKLLTTKPITPTTGVMSQNPILNPDKTVVCQLQFEGKLIPVHMRADGYINVTSLCKAGGKDIRKWRAKKSSTDLINSLSQLTGIPVSSILQSQSGQHTGGTFAHPDIAIQIAQWVSVEFAIQVSRWTRELHKENHKLTSSVDLESLKSPVKQLSLNSYTIAMREGDGYINVSELCKAGMKQFNHWNVNDRSKSFLKVLKRSTGIPMDLLISSVMTGPNDTRGTWAHPQVAINIAQWISPEFDVQVSKWVYELTFTGSVTLGKEKNEEAIQKAFRQMIGIDLRPYDKKDVLYFGIFEASNDIEFEGELSEDTMLCKFGVTSDIAMRNGSHEGGKQFPKFRIVHVVEAGSRNDVSAAEKDVKRVVTQMGLRINYGKSRECFMATEEQLRRVVTRANEFVQEEVEEVPDIRLEMRRLDLEGKKMEMAEKKMEMEMAEKKMEMEMAEKKMEMEMEMAEKKMKMQMEMAEKKIEMESRLIGLFSEGKLTYEQMREMLEK